MILSDFFDKVYCINLDKRPDRWKKVNIEFEKNGFKNVERFPAVDGKTIINNTHLLDGELGIIKTHLKLIQKCKLENLNNVLIMEDDVTFSDDIKNIEKFLQDIPSDWEMIYFGGNHKQSIPPTHIKNNVYKLNGTVAIQCVAINSSIFDEILYNLPKYPFQVDNFYTEIQKKGKVYGLIPNLVFQTEDYSDIQNKLVNYDYLLK
jgi:GR25 family glycosyltransferase involved in LPS biosynthesis